MKQPRTYHMLLLDALSLLAILLVVALVAAAQEAHYRVGTGALLNDVTVTPGAVRTTDAKAVCGGGSTKQFRHTTEAMKNRVYAQYGAKKKPGICCEVDHLISLELGGADDVKNLWPQPYEPRPGAHEKDAVENWLHREVCSGRIPLAKAQHDIATDWFAVYQRMPKKH